MNGSLGPRRRTTRLSVAALVVTVAVVAVGLLTQSSDQPTAGQRPVASPRPSPSTDLSVLRLDRAPFCPLIGLGAVRRALGGAVLRAQHYDSGDRASIAPGVTDVAHEYGCRYDGVGGTAARAWLFAAPVQRTDATDLVRRAGRTPGCHVVQAAAFGDPSVATTCALHGPARVSMTLSGLFGDSWLSCQVTDPGRTASASLRRRSEAWCRAVVTTIATDAP